MNMSFISIGKDINLSSIRFPDLNAALRSEDTLIIDARPLIFYELGHIPNAVSLPLVNFEDSYSEVTQKYDLDKFKQIIVYCSDKDCGDSIKLGLNYNLKGCAIL